MHACPLCLCPDHKAANPAVGDYEYGSDWLADYWTCSKCGAVYQHPLPTDSVLRQAYPPNYHAYSRPSNALAHWLKDQYWQKKAAIVDRTLPGIGPVLDVGCGNGDLLLALRKRSYEDLVGLDFDGNMLEKLRTVGLKTYMGEIEEADLPENYFSAITMTNVIEHMRDPIKVLKRCFELLRPGGIVFGETPNIDCWDYRLFGKYWGGYHAPRHFVLFTKVTIRKAGVDAGFEVELVGNMIQPSHWALAVQNMLRDSALRLKVTGGRSALFTPLLLGLTPVNIIQAMISDTTSIEFVYRKIVD